VGDLVIELEIELVFPMDRRAGKIGCDFQLVGK
jgi:hypothetical protein